MLSGLFFRMRIAVSFFLVVTVIMSTMRMQAFGILKFVTFTGSDRACTKGQQKQNVFHLGAVIAELDDVGNTGNAIFSRSHRSFS